MILEADNLTHQSELLESMASGARLIVPKHIRTLGERTDFGKGLLEPWVRYVRRRLGESSGEMIRLSA